MSELTPDAHDQRIAELRQRRRARVRYLGVRAVVLAGVLMLAVVVFVTWLLTTIGGRELLLGQIVARLPANATLTWQQAEGPARGPLTLRGVRFAYTPVCALDGTQCKPGGPIVFTAQRVHLDYALRPLLGRRLRLQTLQVAGATLALPRSDEPFELPRWPESLPRIAPPLALQVDALRIDGLRVTRAGDSSIDESLINIRNLRGGLDAQPGRLHVERLVIDSDRGRFTVHGDYAPRDAYRSDLIATAVLPAAAGRTPARLGFVARGDLSRMDVALAGAAPGPVRATLTLRGAGVEQTSIAGSGKLLSGPTTVNPDQPQWQLRVAADALDLGLLTDPDAVAGDTPLTLQLQADGSGGNARVRGELRQGDWVARVLTSQVRIEDQVLRVNPLHLQMLEGTVLIRGSADFNQPENATFRFAANARNLRWGGSDKTAAQAATPAIGGNADLGFAGTLKAWAAIGTATLTRAGQAADLRFDGRGNDERMTIKTLTATMPTGTLDATGAIAWAPTLQWKLDATLAGFDPGYFAAGWDGAINGRLATTGNARPATGPGQAGGGFDADLAVTQLGGQLRGRPLGGHGTVALRGDVYRGDVALTLGGSRIDASGTVADTLDIDARFTPLQLADLLPDAAGTLRGTLRLTGARTAPNVDADLSGSGLAYGDYRAATLSAKGRLPWRTGTGALAVRATGLEAGIAFDTLAIDAHGAVEALQLDATARGGIGALALSGNAGKRGGTWQGALASLQLAPSRGAAWRLQQPARFRWSSSPGAGKSGALTNACLASSGGGSLCANADWPRRGIDVTGAGLPLTLLLPYLPEREDRRPWLLRGEVAINAQLRPVGTGSSGAGWRGEATLTSASGGIKNSERARREVIRYGALTLRTTFDPQRITAELGGVLNDDGRIDAAVATGWDAYAPLSGEIAASTDEITWMELFSPDIVEPQGRLDGRITLAGTRAQPRLGGQARLSQFTTELPALAITLQGGDFRLDAQPDGSARIAGSVRSGEGTLNVDGSLGWRGDPASTKSRPLVLNLRGSNVLLSDTRDLRAVVDPDVVVRYTAGEPLQVTGTVTVPTARIDLERLDQGVSASPDVVVLDPVDPKASATSPLDMDLTIALGDDVRLNGFGLDGGLGGRLRVRARPGREMTASGSLDIDGRYTAYGQKLDITRGRLLWSNSPIADPTLNIRAEREVGDVTAGVDVTGRASSPQASVWSNPASSQSEALAYLALGRPLSSISGDEGRQLNAASAALSAGGSLLASQLGARIGLDDAGVMDSRALGGSVLGVGKYLSPKLYVGVGVSLLGTGQVLTLKYLLRKGFDIEIESSTVENRASVNWRKEK